MIRNRLRCRLAAVVLGLALLAPSAARAQRPRAVGPAHAEQSVLAALWNFVSSLFGELKGRGQLDPNGLTGTGDPGGDHRGQMDPDGFTTAADPGGENRGQIDPNG